VEVTGTPQEWVSSSSLAQSVIIDLEDSSHVGESRRFATVVADRAGLDETARGQVALLTTEMANNISKFAGRGTILCRPLAAGSGGGVEIIAVDAGPGLDVQRCMVDGFSSSGTPGTGLGAIRRNATFFDIYSQPGKGTVVMAQVRPRGVAPNGFVTTGAINIPKKGEPVSGDAWAILSDGSEFVCTVIDGLGHGQGAADASRAAVGVFVNSRGAAVERVLEDAHGALRSTRGAAMAVAALSPREGALRFAGVGNISASVWNTSGSRSLVSHNGTLGHEARRFQQFRYDLTPRDILVMHSDGLATQWRLDQYPGLPMRHPSVIAAVLWRDHSRGRDDVTVLVVKQGSANE
jgi:anti-sigma regulatory factor (Ser/Thr protein kinase)